MTKNQEVISIIQYFVKKYNDKYYINPEMSWGICASMLNKHLKKHSVKGILRIVDLYFDDPVIKFHHLPNALSAGSMNKYLPKLKFNPMIYASADELNKDLF